MKVLKTFDYRDYPIGGPIYKRPSVRAIIIQDGHIGLIHSLKYDYYKFPGGGINDGETYRQALCREVKEESGLLVNPDSIKEYGSVIRKEKGNADGTFVQYNFYYFCSCLKMKVDQNLDSYEKEELFNLEWVSPQKAIEINKTHNHNSKETYKFCHMLQRDNFVLETLLKDNSIF